MAYKSFIRVERRSVGFDDNLILGSHQAPDPNDIAPGQLGLWFDPTDGAAALKTTGRSLDGTLFTYTLTGSGGGGGGVTVAGPTGSIQFNAGGGVPGGNADLVFHPYAGSVGGLFVGPVTNTEIGGPAGIVNWPNRQSVENYDGFFISGVGILGGYTETGYYYKNATSSALQDLFYTGAQVQLNDGVITDQSFFIESVPDYKPELAVRTNQIRVRPASVLAWNSVDDGPLDQPSPPDIGIVRSAAGVLEINNGSAISGTGLYGQLNLGILQVGDATKAAGIHVQGAGAFDVDGGGTKAQLWLDRDNSDYSLVLTNVVAGRSRYTGMQVLDDGSFELDASNGSGSGSLIYSPVSQRWQLFGAVQASSWISTTRNTAPADGDLAANELAHWLDPTNGAAKVMFKGKSANGTVVIGNISLA